MREKSRKRIFWQSFYLSQRTRDPKRKAVISEITERYLRAISCEVIGNPNYTQMLESQCDRSYPQSVYMQPKTTQRFGMTLKGYLIRENLSMHEAKLIYKSWPDRSRKYLHLTRE